MNPARASSAIMTAIAAVAMSTAAHASARSTISHPPVGAPDIAPDDPLARFHALDRGQRETRALGEFALIDLQQRPCGPHLRSSYHVLDIRIDILYIAIHA